MCAAGTLTAKIPILSVALSKIFHFSGKERARNGAPAVVTIYAPADSLW
jgi:hypothetical protein